MPETVNTNLLDAPIVRSVLLSNPILLADRAFLLSQAYAYLAELQGGATAIEIWRRRRAKSAALIAPAANGYTLIENPSFFRLPSVTPDGSYAFIRLTGYMSAEGYASTPGASEIISDLRAAYVNEKIKGVVFEINSGGGEVTAMRMLASAISEPRNKPVLSFVHFGASAAYGVAAATDEIIMSSPDARVGSIGAMLSLNKNELAYLSETTITLIGSDSPNKNRDMSMALSGDYSGLQALVDEETKRFHAYVKKSRPLKGNENRIASTLSGDIFYGEDAKRRGLIDGIGEMTFLLSRAETWAKKMKKNPKAESIRETNATN